MALDENLAVQVEQLSKVYRLYEQPSDRLKELLALGRGIGVQNA